MSCRFLRFFPSPIGRGRFVTIALRRVLASSPPSIEGAAGLRHPSSLALIGIYGYWGLYLVIITILVRTVIVRWSRFFGCGIENRMTYYDK